MSSHRFSLILIFLALGLTLISMVIGPFGIVNWALTTAVVACFFALASVIVSMQSWEEQDEEDRGAAREQRQSQQEQTAEISR